MVGWIAIMLAAQYDAERQREARIIGRVPMSFTLPSLDGQGSVSLPTKGKVTILSIFASWCQYCRIEHPTLMKLAAMKKVPIIGLAWKDDPEKTKAWLAKYGTPYTQVALDEDAISTVPLSLTGIPQTYIFDKAGRVAYSKKAVLDQEELETVILPLVEKLQHE